MLGELYLKAIIMKSFIPIFAICIFCFASADLSAQNEPTKQETPKEEFRMEDNETKEEINPIELPDEARRDIVDNYHNGEILKAYKIIHGGKMIGYLAEVKKGPKTWYVRFDKDGNAENKITPLGL